MAVSRLGGAPALAALIVGLSAPSDAVEVPGNQVTLGWSPASGPVAGYYVIVARDAGTPKVESVTVAPQKTLSGAIGEKLVVQVAAFGQDGVAGPVSPPSEPLTFVQDSGSGTTTPPPPSGDGGSDTEPPPSDGGPSGGSGPAVARDFNGDGISDLVVRSGSAVRLWVMQGAHVASDLALPAAPAGSNVVGTGDYDGNLNADLLWENSSTGALTLWRLAGGQVIGTTVLDRSSLPAAEEWLVGGSGDVDGDGADDLMLWSRVKGQVEIWTFSGGAVATRTRLTGHVGAWSVVAVDDIDGDGKAELVWLDELHRVLELRDPAAAASVGLGDLAAGWRGRGGADLAGDGSAELVLQDTATGAAQAWELDDRGVVGSGDLPTARNLGAYAGAGDFDGNGSEDIAWSDTTDRAVTLWLGSAGAPVSRLVDRPLPTGGEVVSGATASDDSAFRDRFCASDLNGDGRVTNRDVKVIKVCLDKPGTGDCEIADMDGDRWVTTGDFDVFVLRFRHQRCEPW